MVKCPRGDYRQMTVIQRAIVDDKVSFRLMRRVADLDVLCWLFTLGGV